MKRQKKSQAIKLNIPRNTKKNYCRSFLHSAILLFLVSYAHGQALQPGVIAGDQTVCPGTPVASFSSIALASGGTGSITYVWEAAAFTTGFGIVGSATPTLAGFNFGPGSYYLRRGAYTGVDATVYSNTLTIYKHPIVTSIISTSANEACPGQPFSFSITSANAVSFNWTGPAGLLSNASSFTLTNPQYFNQGLYTCAVTTTTGCIFIHTYNLNVRYFAGVTPVTKCTGLPATLNVINGAITYTWTGPAGYTGGGSTAYIYPVNNITSGTYSITAEFPNACILTTYINLVALPLPTVQIISTQSQICTGQNVQFVGFTFSGASNYYWSGSQALLQNPVVTLAPTETTTYTVIGEDANSCKSSAQSIITVGECTGLWESVSSTGEINIYPNPSSGSFGISSSHKATFYIVNTSGQLIDTIELNDQNHFTCNTTKFAPGIYYIVPENSSTTKTRKLVVYK